MKNPDDHRTLMIDPAAAEVVQEIFTLASTAYGYNAIVKCLTQKKIFTPQSHFVSQNPDYYRKKVFTPHCDWNNKTVQVILNNSIYLGHTVYGKTCSKKIRGKDRAHRPEDEWIVRENTHEAVISQDLWDTAHEKLRLRKKSGKSGEVHMFSGYLFCEDCGAAMTFYNRDLHKEHNGEFVCGTYKRKGKTRCSTHYITYESVYNVILQDIKSKSLEANRNECRFIQLLAQESEMIDTRSSMRTLRDIELVKLRVEQLDQIIAKLYEDSALGVIPTERFNLMFTKYEAEQKELKQKISEAERLEKQKCGKIEKTKLFTQFIKEVTDMEVLTSTILSKLVKRITVGQAVPNPVTGEKEQGINIEYAVC